MNSKKYIAVGIIFLALLGCFVLFRLIVHSNPKCPNSSNIASIRIEGELATSMAYVGDQTASSVSSRDIVDAIQNADQDNHIKAILLEIDSRGGDGAAAEEIVRALRHTHKPIVAYIRGSGLSAAYWVASAANWIIALETSSLGDIGVKQSYTDNAIQNEQNGITFNQLSVGKYKDMFNTDKSLTFDEKALIMKNLSHIYEILITDIAHNRKLDVEKVRSLADGAPIVADMALKDGLIDEIGGTDAVHDYLKQLIHANPEACSTNP